MIYFDNAATSYPKPASVLAAVNDAVVRCGGNPGRGAHPLASAAAEKVYSCRETICDFFGTNKPENVVFCLNTTMALNLAIKSRVRQGMHVLISDREHNAVFRPIHRLAEKGICTYSCFSCEGDILRNFRKELRKNTGIVVCTQTSNVTGKTLPIEKIGKICHELGIYFVIDGAQSAGHMPIRLGQTEFDAFCAPGHKGLLGICGTGFCIFNDARSLETLWEGGSGYASASPDMPAELPERMEAGTLAVPAIASLEAGIKEVGRIGVGEISERETQLKKTLAEDMASLPHIRLIEPQNPGGVLSFVHDEKSSEEIAARLAENGICVRGGLQCAPLAHRALGTENGGTVRISLSFSNTQKEGKTFARTLAGILRS